MEVIIQSISDSFKGCSPFLEPTLLVAFHAKPEKVKNIVIRACKKVLSAPIIKAEHEWFKQYVFPSSIWLLETKKDRFAW